MAALTTAQTKRVAHAFVYEQLVEQGLACGLTKAQVEEAVTAVNTWVDANATSYTTNLSTNAAAFAAFATGQQEAIMLIYVLIVKYNLAGALIK